MQQQTKLDYEFTATRTARGNKIRFNFRGFKKLEYTGLPLPHLPNIPTKWLLEKKSFLRLMHMISIVTHEIILF